ncbi:19561_t:CDS:2 [Dentiscutata erythropus]|uniref:19561_t:CDS:1 n=1 Tax=Dentiscutata erythropus TaxID=1348616 RepID=A0A9N9JJ88_9GLOM|nr:19561_t:CDS:2 [Dentiscutata erythropus]
MPRIHSKKLTRSDNIDPFENLVEFYEEHVKYLQHEQRRVTNFLNKNNIKGDHMTSKLIKLQELIDKSNGGRSKAKEYKKSNPLDIVIKTLTNQKDESNRKNEELQKEINELRQRVQELESDLHYERMLNNRTIENFSNTEERYRTMAILQRSNTMIFDEEEYT